MYSRTSVLFFGSLCLMLALGDETAVQVCPRIGPGLVVKRPYWHQFAPRAANRKSARRAAVTYMGLVCSEDRSFFTQVIKANNHLFSRKLLQQLQSEDWDNVHMFENVHFCILPSFHHRLCTAPFGQGYYGSLSRTAASRTIYSGRAVVEQKTQTNKQTEKDHRTIRLHVGEAGRECVFKPCFWGRARGCLLV